MGRSSTGSTTTGRSLSISVKSFADQIKRGTTFMEGSISWRTGANIGFKLLREQGHFDVVFKYDRTCNGEQNQVNYRVPLVSIPSNLGKGEVFYFQCPFSQVRCKELYLAYGSSYFKSRAAYKHRIYYSSQLSSRLDRHNDAYWRISKQLGELYKKHPKTHYRGKSTTASVRIERLEAKMRHHENMRWIVLPKVLQKHLGLPF